MPASGPATTLFPAGNIYMLTQGRLLYNFVLMSIPTCTILACSTCLCIFAVYSTADFNPCGKLQKNVRSINFLLFIIPRNVQEFHVVTALCLHCHCSQCSLCSTQSFSDFYPALYRFDWAIHYSIASRQF